MYIRNLERAAKRKKKVSTNMGDKITHEGIVKSIEGNTVTVQIQAHEACGACHAKGLCSMSGKTDKDIGIKTKRAGEYRVGERVTVSLMSGMGLRAVFYAYVLSLAAGAVCFTAAALLGLGDALRALCGLGGVALYFVVLRLCSMRLNRRFTFQIEKINL